jgi:hypothetical protein
LVQKARRCISGAARSCLKSSGKTVRVSMPSSWHLSGEGRS